MTDSLVNAVSRSRYRGADYYYRYPKAPMGFVFHNTKGVVDLEDIKYPLFKLRELFSNPVPTGAVIFKIRDDTYAATYSLSAIPRPIDVGRLNQRNNMTLRMYPQTGDSPGWYISDVTDKSAEVLAFDMGHVYDNCIHLQRLMGACPCPNLANGTCTKENILPAFNGLLDESALSSDYGSINTKATAHPSYQTLGAFRYISPIYTTGQDFYQALRPWDAVDFSHVEYRVKEIEQRSAHRVEVNKYVKEHCKKCAFVNTRKNKAGNDIFSACVRNPADHCSGEISVEDADKLMRLWYDKIGFGSIKTFTPTQINGLVTLTGSILSNRGALCTTRKIDVVLSGFLRISNQWVYRVSAWKGDTRRAVNYSNFKDLIDSVPEIVELLKQPHPELPFLRLLGCAALGLHLTDSVGRGNEHRAYCITPGAYKTKPEDRLKYEDDTDETLCAMSTFTSGRYLRQRYTLYKHRYAQQWVQFISHEWKATQLLKIYKSD